LKTLPAPEDFLPLLSQGRWFAGLPGDVRQRLMAQAAVRLLPAGHRLFSRGDPNDGLYAVVDGAVRIGGISADGKEAVLSMIEPPLWFGEIALFDAGPRTHDADTRAPTTVLHVPLHALQDQLAAHPGDWHHLGALAVEKMRAVLSGLEELTLLPAPQRMARRLWEMSLGHGMLTEQGARSALAVNQEQLGAMLALSRQTVNEVLRHLEAQGIVARRYGRIEILDREALRAAGDVPDSTRARPWPQNRRHDHP
jgi:CRP/FNR family transcriptional regulator, cyclic AMP receptor protein